MKKILLFGSQGMLGTQFFTDACESFFIIPLSRFHIDLLEPEKIEKIIEEHNPDIVINASAWTDVESAENPKNYEDVLTINAKSPGEMARVCHKRNIPFYHISTDFVFSGAEKDVFEENSPKNPCNVYGTSKAKGEEEALQYQTTKIFRTAWLYGEYGHNFVQRIVHLLKNPPRNGSGIKGVCDQWGSPTWTKNVSEVLMQACHFPERFPEQVYHAVNEGAVSRREWIEKISQILGFTKPIVSISHNSFVSLAKRPNSSVLKNTRMPLLPSWDISLKEYLLKK